MEKKRRIQLVKILAEYLPEKDDEIRYVLLDKVDRDILDGEHEGSLLNLTLDILGGVAVGGIECRLAFEEDELASDKVRQLYEEDFAVIVSD